MNDTANIKRQFFDSLKRETGEAFLIATEQEDTWSLTHLFDLAKLFSRFKNQEGKWGIPINMGDKINTQEWERFPVVPGR